MKLLSLIFVLGLGFCSAVTAQEGFEIPSDNDTVIFSMDFSGGLRMQTPEGFVRQPYLQVFANGRVLNSPNSPDHPAHEFRMDEGQLNDFLTKIVTECQIYEINGEEIAKAIKASGQRIMIADAPSLDLTVELGQGNHAISVYAASIAARQFPDIEELQSVTKIESHARHLVRVATAGGFAELDAALTKVNEVLTADGHDPMTLENLQMCRMIRDNLHIHFTKKTMEGKRTVDWVTAKLIRTGDEESIGITTKAGKSGQ